MEVSIGECRVVLMCVFVRVRVFARMCGCVDEQCISVGLCSCYDNRA